MTIDSAYDASEHPDVEARVRFLEKPENHPDRPQRIEVRETHTSWLFLTPKYVYKLKKPLRYDFLDFGTVAARLRNCRAELRLNRRLARNVYLGILPLTLTAAGGMRLGGEGLPIDWLVKMNRLAEDRVLERRIETGSVRDEDLVTLALRLSAFYEQAPPIGTDMFLYVERFRHDLDEHRRELARPGFGLQTEWINAIAEAQEVFLKQNTALLAERVRQERIVEAHGDLRPEHIYLGSEPVIIDCLEFNRDFRILDPADELAFLAMECERLGAAFVGERVLQVYGEASGDRPPAALVDFYMSYRAMLWAKLAIWHLRGRADGERGKWVDKANGYLSLAEAHIQKAS